MNSLILLSLRNLKSYYKMSPTNHWMIFTNSRASALLLSPSAITSFHLGWLP